MKPRLTCELACWKCDSCEPIVCWSRRVTCRQSSGLIIRSVHAIADPAHLSWLIGAVASTVSPRTEATALPVLVAIAGHISARAARATTAWLACWGPGGEERTFSRKPERW